MTTVHAGEIELPCLAPGPSRQHRLFIDPTGSLKTDPDDTELIAELIGGNSRCLHDAEHALAAVHHRNDVITRRKRPSVTLRISTTPEDLRSLGLSPAGAESESAEPRWPVEGQKGCCIDGYYIDPRNAIEHTLRPAHLAAQFGCSINAIYAINPHVSKSESFGTYKRPPTPGRPSCLSEAVLDALWDHGVAPNPSAPPGPWTAPGFPDRLTFACELARAYTRSGVDFTHERMRDIWNKRATPDDYANLMHQLRFGRPFDIKFKHDLP